MTSSTDVPHVPLPMFPLGLVLVPTMPLGLHAFEPRYKALVRDCLRDRGEFGIVLIERGHEVGGGDERFAVGTAAHIVESAEYPDGRWDLVVRGTRRLRVMTWLPDDPYPLALVAELPRDSASVDAEALAGAEQAVRRALTLLSELGEAGPVPLSFVLDPEPQRAVWQLVVAAPLSPIDKQRLLEEDDASVRLRLLADMAGEAGDVLAYRLSGG